MRDCIDIHTHGVPETFPPYAGRGANVPWPSMADAHACHKHVMIQGKVYRTVSDGCWSVPRRIEDMGAMQVARQAISPMPELLSYWLPLDDAKAMLRYLNEQIAAMIARAPDRFIGRGAGSNRRRLPGAGGMLPGRHRARSGFDDHRRRCRAPSEAAHRLQPWRRRDVDPARAPGARLERVSQGERVAGRIAGDHRTTLLLRPAGVRSRRGRFPDQELWRGADRRRHGLPVCARRYPSDEDPGAGRDPRRDAGGDHLDEREALSRAGLTTSFESTSLIEPGSTASATSSNGVGWAFTITSFAPAERAMSTAPAIG